MSTAEQSDVILTAIAIGITLLLGVAIIGPIVGSVSVAGTEDNEEIASINGGSASVSGFNITFLSVDQSLGHAAKLDGSRTSYISGETAPSTSGNWTLSTAVSVDNTTGTRTVYADDSRWLFYNGSSNQWRCVYYDAESGNTWVVGQLASDPDNLTNVMCMLDGGALSVIEDNSLSSTVAANDSMATTETFDGENLNGTLDETRVYNRSLESSDRQQLVDTPTAPLTGERAYRVMFDTYSTAPSTYPAFFVMGDVTAENVDRVSGYAQEPTTEGTDYSISGGTVSVESGGSLDNAPAVYLSYQAGGGALGGALNTAITTLSSSLELGAVVVLIVISIGVLGALNSIGNGGRR